jgi:hypothetical protein
LLVRLPPEIPSRKPDRRQFRFAVPRRDQQHQPVNLAALDPLKLAAMIL